MDYKLKGTVRRQFSATVQRKWTSEFTKHFSGLFIGYKFRIALVTRKWRGKHSKRLKTTFLGRGKPV